MSYCPPDRTKIRMYENRIFIMLQKINEIKIKVFLITALVVLVTQIFCIADENSPDDAKAETGDPVLKLAVLCESLSDDKNPLPVNQAVVFSSNLGRLICFTDFDPVYEQTFVFHKYYFKDEFSSKKKLKLYPPRWAVRSSIQLRDTDKGPWRVDITDADGKVLESIRFSITD